MNLTSLWDDDAIVEHTWSVSRVTLMMFPVDVTQLTLLSQASMPFSMSEIQRDVSSDGIV